MEMRLYNSSKGDPQAVHRYHRGLDLNHEFHTSDKHCLYVHASVIEVVHNQSSGLEG